MDEHHEQQIPEGYEPGSDADIHITSILFVGIIGAVLTIVIVLLLKAFYYQTLNEERERKLGKGIDVQLADLRTAQLEQLARYRWVNARAGTVGIPIEDAMTLVVTELAGRPNNGIEIADWDHAASDLHPTPGNMVLLGRDGYTNIEITSRYWGDVEVGRTVNITPNVENLSGTEEAPAEAIAAPPALQLDVDAIHGERLGDEAAGGDH